MKFSRAKGELATDCLKSSEKLRKESFNVMQKTLLQPRPDHVQNSRSMLFSSRLKIGPLSLVFKSEVFNLFSCFLNGL